MQRCLGRACRSWSFMRMAVAFVRCLPLSALRGAMRFSSSRRSRLGSSRIPKRFTSHARRLRSNLPRGQLRILAGSDGLGKPDRGGGRFITRVTGLESTIRPADAAKVLIQAAHVLRVAPRLLDHRIWEY